MKNRKDAPVAPLPAVIAGAKKIFLSNGGGSNLAYDAFYSSMKEWGKYEVTQRLYTEQMYASTRQHGWPGWNRCFTRYCRRKEKRSFLCLNALDGSVIQEQVFAPRTRGLNYVRVKGLNFEHAANAFPVPQRGMVSASRGSYWIIEDCTLRHANSVALDIGAQDWDMESPGVVGHSIVRRNHIDDVGVCGIAGMAIQDSLLESNLIEHVGWQDVELTWETGGIKLHTTKNCLLRTNVIRHLVHSEAIWLDYLNSNTRVTANVMGDTLETLRGGIYLEASHDANMLDHNIIWKATEGKGGGSFNMPPHGGWGIAVDGSDETVVAHNLIGYTQDAAIKFRTIEGRIVGSRGGTSPSIPCAVARFRAAADHSLLEIAPVGVAGH